MQIGFDAKRAFHNMRGLGNYSRDVVRILNTFVPEIRCVLFGKPTTNFLFPHARIVEPHGISRFFPSLWRSVGCLSQMNDLDVFHGLSGELPFGIHRRRNLLKVVTMHDAIFVRYPELYSRTYRWIFTQKVRYALRAADVVIAISEQTKADLIRFFAADEHKIRVVYQGCHNRFRQQISQQNAKSVCQKYNLPERFVLTVGAIEPRKNLENLIRAVAQLPQKLTIVAVGGQSKYAAQMANLALASQVDLRLLHGVPMDELPALYKSATLFAYPSLFEGFGIPILEAMCVGVPVLTSEGSCFAETGGKAAIYANPLNINDLSEKILQIISDENLRKTMITNGFLQAGKFTDDKIAQNLLNIYRYENID